MKTVVIAEKPSQAKNILSALGKSRGNVVAAQGHLFEIVKPQFLNPEWRKWGYHVLSPKGGYPIKPSQDKIKILNNVIKNLKNADMVIVATDSDREGQAIADDILKYAVTKNKLRKNVTVKRAVFNAEDPQTLKKAFNNLENNEEWAGMSASARTRRDADAIMGLSATAAATITMPKYSKGKMKGVMHTGRLKGPILDIVVKNDKVIENFKPETRYNFKIIKDGVTFTFAPEEPITDKKQAEKLIAEIKKMGNIPIAVKATKISKTPPHLPDLTDLAKTASQVFGWSAAKAGKIANQLYNKNLITYPNTDGKQLQPTQKGDMTKIFNGLKYVPGLDFDNKNPILRNHHTFSSQRLSAKSHHAIIPNANNAHSFGKNFKTLSGDEKALFKMIASRTAAVMLENQEIIRSDASISLKLANGKKIEFIATGEEMVNAGWGKVMGVTKTDHPPLPKDLKGKTADMANATLNPYETTPPTRLTEGTLIEAMKNAGQGDENILKADKRILLAVEGVGQPRTRGPAIEQMKADRKNNKQGYIEVKDGKIYPTYEGKYLHKLLSAVSPDILSPVKTARLEAKLSLISDNEYSPTQLRQEIEQDVRKWMDGFKSYALLQDMARQDIKAKQKIFNEQLKSSPLNITLSYEDTEQILLADKKLSGCNKDNNNIASPDFIKKIRNESLSSSYGKESENKEDVAKYASCAIALKNKEYFTVESLTDAAKYFDANLRKSEDETYGVGNSYIAPDAKIVRDKTEEILTWAQNAQAQKILPPALIGAALHIELLKLHPFTDGNGRLARLVHGNILKNGYGGDFMHLLPEYAIGKHKERYFQELENLGRNYEESQKSNHANAIRLLTGRIGENAEMLAVEIVNDKAPRNTYQKLMDNIHNDQTVITNPAILERMEQSLADDPDLQSSYEALKNNEIYLPMDEKSRHARARFMGFDTSRPLYHGTSVEFESFDRSRRGDSTRSPSAKRGFFLTSNADVAALYAQYSSSIRQNVNDLILGSFVKSDKTASLNIGTVDNPTVAEEKKVSALDEVFSNGYDMLYIPKTKPFHLKLQGKNPIHDEYIVKNPEQIRSIFAAFDPRLSTSAHLSYNVQFADDAATSFKENIVIKQLSDFLYEQGHENFNIINDDKNINDLVNMPGWVLLDADHGLTLAADSNIYESYEAAKQAKNNLLLHKENTSISKSKISFSVAGQVEIKGDNEDKLPIANIDIKDIWANKVAPTKDDLKNNIKALDVIRKVNSSKKLDDEDKKILLSFNGWGNL